MISGISRTQSGDGTGSGIGVLIVVGLTIGSYFIDFSVTENVAARAYTLWGLVLCIGDNVEIVTSLGFLDGLKNGLMTLPHCFGEVFVDSVLDYIMGFYNEDNIKIIWAVWGLVWLPIKNIVLCVPKVVVSHVMLCFQQFSITYILGYFTGVIVVSGCTQVD